MFGLGDDEIKQGYFAILSKLVIVKTKLNLDRRKQIYRLSFLLTRLRTPTNTN